jgi:hypothetical protein
VLGLHQEAWHGERPPGSSVSVSPPIVWRMDRNRLEFAVIPTAIGECALVWNENAEIVGGAYPTQGNLGLEEVPERFDKELLRITKTQFHRLTAQSARLAPSPRCD